jgi:hypothetical protein
VKITEGWGNPVARCGLDGFLALLVPRRYRLELHLELNLELHFHADWIGNSQEIPGLLCAEGAQGGAFVVARPSE